MMDSDTFGKFKQFCGNGEKSSVVTLSNLNNDENILYQELKDKTENNRLEQEKIPQYYVDEKITKCFIYKG